MARDIGTIEQRQHLGVGRHGLIGPFRRVVPLSRMVSSRLTIAWEKSASISPPGRRTRNYDPEPTSAVECYLLEGAGHSNLYGFQHRGKARPLPRVCSRSQTMALKTRSLF
jgi:hypothetical protein